jgi:short-subunit dehydrogenase
MIAATVNTNLLAPLALTHDCLPDLVARRGRIVLMGSTTSTVPLPYLALYSATKAGLHAFGSALRVELQPHGVQLLIAYPPATATALTAAMAARVAQLPGGRFFALATPERIGERIVRALLAGQTECRWWSGEALLATLYRLAPRLTMRLLTTQRRLLAQTVGGDGDRVTAPHA